ncbi:hypothetical protein D3C73_1387560 [compost metagenome]
MPFGKLLDTAPHRACTAIINQLGFPVIRYHHVLRLQVPKHKTAFVQQLQLLQQLQSDQPQPGGTIFGQKEMQRPSLHITHDIKRLIAPAFKVIRFQQIRGERRFTACPVLTALTAGLK